MMYIVSSSILKELSAESLKAILEEISSEEDNHNTLLPPASVRAIFYHKK